MKVQKYFSAALLAGALSLTPKVVLADNDMLTDFHAIDVQEQTRFDVQQFCARIAAL